MKMDTELRDAIENDIVRMMEEDEVELKTAEWIRRSCRKTLKGK